MYYAEGLREGRREDYTSPERRKIRGSVSLKIPGD